MVSSLALSTECPKLEGSYLNCSVGFFSTSTVEIGQKLKDGVWHYSYSENPAISTSSSETVDFISDGKVHVYKDEVAEVRMTSSCSKGELTTRTELSFDIYGYDFKRVFSLDENLDLVIKNYDDEGNHNVEVCEKE